MKRLRTRTLAAALVAAPLAAALAAASFASDEKTGDAAGDVLTRALADEMDRSMRRLKLEPFDGPYRIAYTAEDVETFTAEASFGALERSNRSRSRSLSTDVRVGDPKLDNSNFAGGGGGGAIFFALGLGGLGGTPLPDEDDYAAIRQRAWLATDDAYKTALETLARKKAFLQSNTVPDRPPDLSTDLPRDLAPPYSPRADLVVEEARWASAATDLSAVFRKFKEIQDSGVTFRASSRTHTFLTSEGLRNRTSGTTFRIDVTASTQAEDGMPLEDSLSFVGRFASDLPPLAEMTTSVESMARGLALRAKADTADEYIGPVLFEGEAAAEFVLQLLVDKLSNPREPLGMRGGPGGGTNPFRNRLRKRVMPSFLTVIDDPTVATFGGKPLLGAYAIDDDGFPAEKVTLVEEGRLLAWYMSRVPTREIERTNGHSRGGVGGPGCVFVSSGETAPESKLREELLRNAREQELPYAIRVESIASSGGGGRAFRGGGGRRGRGGFPGGARFGGGGGDVSLGAPIRAYRVYVEDGREEPIRGGEFQSVTLRTLRDVCLTGDARRVVNTTRRGNPVSIVCPSLLVEELEMAKPGLEQEKTPYLSNPFFEKP